MSPGNTASTVAFALNTPTVPAIPLMVVSTPDGLALNGGTHTISVNNSQQLGIGQFTLIDYDGAPITTGFTLAPISGRTAGNLVYNTTNKTIDLNVTGTDSTVWNGNLSADWDLGTDINVGGTNNFKLASTATPTNFFTGDRV